MLWSVALQVLLASSQLVLQQPQSSYLLVCEGHCCLLVGCQLTDDLSCDSSALCEVVDLQGGLLALDLTVIRHTKLGSLGLEVVRDRQLQVAASLQQQVQRSNCSKPQLLCCCT